MSPVPPAVASRLFFRHRYRVSAVAAALAMIAGFVNGVAITAVGQPVSHVTGTIARLSQDLVLERPFDLQLVLLVVATFFVGAVISGAIIGSRRLLPGRRYGVVLLLEGALLGASAVAFLRQPRAGLLFAAAACGLQNGMATSFYGVVVRTTHLSGIITDLAVLTGRWLRRRPVEGWRAAFQSGIVAAFVVGGIAGTSADQRVGPAALFAPAAACAIGGLLYIGLVSRHLAQRPRRKERARQAPG